jgi:CheY-like chemotaxis protein
MACIHRQTDTALTVLCIEEDLATVQLIEDTIGGRPDVELLVAIDGCKGVKLARSHRPDLVLADLELPDMGGEEVLARLRVDPVTRPVSVVMLSADASPAIVARLLARGAQTCLAKPIGAGELTRVLDHGLGGRAYGGLRRAA